jgi:site-specific DNA recombinase
MDSVIYARISSDRTGQEAGVTRQLEDARELARRHGDRVVDEVVDNDTSAFSRKPRPGYTRVVEMVKAGDVRAIYVWHPDRLYRRLRDLEDLVDLVEAHDLVVRTARAGDIDLATSSGRMTARVIGSVAQHESELKAERQARKARQLAEAGKSAGGGRKALGYERDGVTVDEVEAAALRRAAESIVAGGTLADATRQVSADLGHPVRAVGLKGALTGYRIAGLRQHIPAADRRRGVTQGVVTPAVWPAILDDLTWRKVRAVLLDPRRAKQRPARSYLLSRVIRCGRCGRPMSGGSGNYRCDSKNGGCAGLSVNAAPVDEIVERFVRGHVDTPEVRGQLARHGAPDRDSGPGIDELTARLATLAEMLADGLMTADEWKAARDRVALRIGERQTVDADQVAAQTLARQITSVLDDWDAAKVPERRAVIAAVLDTDQLALVIEARGRRNGCRFDPSRVRIVPRDQVRQLRISN